MHAIARNSTLCWCKEISHPRSCGISVAAALALGTWSRTTCSPMLPQASQGHSSDSHITHTPHHRGTGSFQAVHHEHCSKQCTILFLETDLMTPAVRECVHVLIFQVRKNGAVGNTPNIACTAEIHADTGNRPMLQFEEQSFAEQLLPQWKIFLGSPQAVKETSVMCLIPCV